MVVLSGSERPKNLHVLMFSFESFFLSTEVDRSCYIGYYPAYINLNMSCGTALSIN